MFKKRKMRKIAYTKSHQEQAEFLSVTFSKEVLELAINIIAKTTVDVWRARVLKPYR